MERDLALYDRAFEGSKERSYEFLIGVAHAYLEQKQLGKSLAAPASLHLAKEERVMVHGLPTGNLGSNASDSMMIRQRERIGKLGTLRAIPVHQAGGKVAAPIGTMVGSRAGTGPVLVHGETPRVAGAVDRRTKPKPNKLSSRR